MTNASPAPQEPAKPVPKPEPKPAQAKVAKAASQSYIYIGPSLPPAIAPLPQYIVFAGEKPHGPAYDEVFKACPAIQELIIPTSELANARLAMARPGTREHSFSVAVQKFITPTPPAEE